QLKIVDMTGKVILQNLVSEQSAQVDLSAAENGIYIVESTFTDGSIGYAIISKL
ncbi:MAG: T9SS type A sorting domain-containing protein, partial [Bacteroidetes bacterium]|nr:T9SS type A sorting domain-containing protein [Bacteroidota bacterium]